VSDRDRFRRGGLRRRYAFVLAFSFALPLVGASTEALAQTVFTVRLVPPFAGARFALDGREFVSGEDGVAAVSVPTGGTHFLEALPVGQIGDMRARFARWGDDVFSPRRRVDFADTTDMEVGYEISRPITFRFLDLDGKEVNPTRVSELTVRSSLGGVKRYEGIGPHWLQAGRVLRRSTGLQSKDLLYSIDSVMVDGSSVVHRAQQKFLVSDGPVWGITLLLYSVRFRTEDAFFGSPIGSHVVLKYPNGETRRLPLAENGTADVPSLARGNYLAHVDGPGISPPVPVSVSRDFQEARLKVISYLDLALFGLVLLGTAVALVLIGRPGLRSAVRSRLRLRWGVLVDERLYPPI
jgi:hypothetical protein